MMTGTRARCRYLRSKSNVMKTKRVLLLVATVAQAELLASEPTSTSWSSTASIEGYVRNQYDETVPSASVVLRHHESVVMYTITDTSGFYNMIGLPPGKYTIAAYYPGYLDTLIEVELVSDKITFCDLTVVMPVGGTTFIFHIPDHKKPVNPGDPSWRPVWNSDQIEHNAGQDYTTLLSHTPTVNIRDDGDKEGSMIGAQFGDNITIIDDMVVRGIGIDFPKGAIQELSAYLTGVPARYGDFIGGAVIINTKSP